MRFVLRKDFAAAKSAGAGFRWGPKAGGMSRAAGAARQWTARKKVQTSADRRALVVIFEQTFDPGPRINCIIPAAVIRLGSGPCTRASTWCGAPMHDRIGLW